MNNIGGQNIKTREDIDNSIYIETPPMRISFVVIDELKKCGIICENSNILDIGAAAGDFLLYCKKNINTNITNGINYFNERHKLNDKILKENDIHIQYCDAIKYNYYDFIYDIYWLWIEYPDTELEIIELIKKAAKYNNKSCKIIICYETMQYICNNCSHCINIRDNIDNKWKTYRNLNNFKKAINCDVQHKHIYFNTGDNCRQKGIYTLIIITI